MSVTHERNDGVVVITLDRPEKLNSLTREMRAELQAAWADASSDREVRAVVITGAGDRSFCTGNDLSATPPSSDPFAIEAFAADGDDGLMKGLHPDLPVVAAINGYAIGGGLEIALACDIRIASPNAEFALTEAKVGSIPGAGGTQLLPRTVGRSLAMQMLLTGERIDAERALQAGLVSEIVAPDGLLTRALAIAEAIAANAPLSVAAIKRLVRFGDEASLGAALQAERLAFGLIRTTADRQEGRAAFTERRPPRFTGA
jgi:E-phenylitaconyl-CoA hydratase